jgi:hypothetical protein
VHLRDELAECGLLVRAALEDELHAVKLHAVGRGATVVRSVGQRTHSVGKRDPLAFIDWVDDANGGRNMLCLGGDGTEEDTGQHAKGERA